MADSPTLFNGSAMSLVGYEMVRTAAIGALAGAGMLIADVKLVELCDCFSTK